jgi:hypothetical protein
MDHEKFDRLARRLVHVHDRREFVGLGAVLAAFAFGFAWRSAGGQAACPDGCPDGQTCVNGGCLRPCQNDRDCRSKKDDPCISNTCADSYCLGAIADCQPGYECCRGECCTKSCVDDAECAVLDPCRLSRCGSEGVCEFTQIDPCVVCNGDEDCVNSGADMICCDGSCKKRCPEGTAMGKGCECRADSSATQNGLVVRDDASG